MNSENDSRLVNIEIKMVHQEQTIDELNDALYKQQQRMDLLEKTITDLQKRMSTADSDIRANEKPPHY